MDEGVFLDVSPENTVSGRTVSFSVAGLPPWEPVTISFNDPAGVRATWITSEDVHLVNDSDVRATTLIMYPNASGELSWERYATQDATGDWTMDIDLAASVYRSVYTMEDLKLNDFERILLGTLLTRRDAGNFVIYYSELIPTALVVDLQEHLSETVLLLDRKIQTETKQIPDIYLLGNREIVNKVSTFTGTNLGFEDGYYTNFGERRGIFMRTDLLETEARRLLTHEYVHHIFGGLSRNQEMPAWLTEGLAEYYEFDIALSGPRPEASELRLYTSADLARTAAQDGTLFSLNTLDSQSDWNSRTGDDVPLQYAEAYMAVRFLNETYGALAGKDLLVTMAKDSNLSDALNTVTGLDLELFELQFTRWLAKWDDLERKALSEYITALDVILTAETANSHLRAQNLQASMTYEETVNSHAFLVRSTEALIQDLQALSPPERAQALHQEIEEHFGRVLVWLSLELQAAEAFDNGLLIAANNTIPEINACDLNVKRNLSNLEFVLNLQD